MGQILEESKRIRSATEDDGVHGVSCREADPPRVTERNEER
jgi:hypothetical protein